MLVLTFPPTLQLLVLIFPTQRVQELGAQLEQLEVQLAPSSPFGLHRRLEAVAAVARLRSGATGGPPPPPLDAQSAQRLFGVLKEHADAVKRLQEVLRSDALDVEVMRREGQQESMVSMAVVPL